MGALIALMAVVTDSCAVDRTDRLIVLMVAINDTAVTIAANRHGFWRSKHI